MIQARSTGFFVAALMVLSLSTPCFATKEQARPLSAEDLTHPHPVGNRPSIAGRQGIAFGSGPFVISQQGNITWVEPYPDTTYCPGDPARGHGGEATGGPDGSETWCFEGGPGDTCGITPPYNVLCWDHIDVRTMPSEWDTNYWHVDTNMGINGGEVYSGTFCLWCGSNALWINGDPVECGTWQSPPGYGDNWNCIAELTLPDTFTVATGCTVYFDTRYDTECKYDYFYCEVADTSGWQLVAMFNASSNNPGGRCGTPATPNPDYWDHTDIGQPFTADWVTRAIPNEPAFSEAVDTLLAGITQGPRFRWRFFSDGAWSDADGRGDTDGAAFIDNVWIVGDGGMKYEEDFEAGTVGPEWSFPPADSVCQAWHLTHDPDAPYEGGDGGDRTTCLIDSSVVWRARPEKGYPAGAEWRNGWYYRLLSPVIPIQNTGCIFQYDRYLCYPPFTGDYADTKVRFYDTTYGWCPWINIDGYILYGGCAFWQINFEEHVSSLYGSTADSVQFGWDHIDMSHPDDASYGKHARVDQLVDNVSIGFYDNSATRFTLRPIDRFVPLFHDSLCAYNSFFAAGNLDSLEYYKDEQHPLRWDRQLRVTVTDPDEIWGVRLYGSIDKGATWTWLSMTLKEPVDPANPDLGGAMYQTFCPSDFGLVRWDKGTILWYYITCEDKDGAPGNIEYFPSTADPANPAHTGTREDYLTFSILPLFPPGYTGPKILLVDGHQWDVYDWSPCFATDDNLVPIGEIYERTLVDAGYCYDKYDIHGAGSNIHIHPTELSAYDAVIWFTGPYLSDYLMDGNSQRALRDHMQTGGKIILIGDRLAYYMCDGATGADSLGGEMCSGIMGISYKGEMESPFVKPYVYMELADTVVVFGTAVAVGEQANFDTVLVYRECPYLKDMSYIMTDPIPAAGYSAQPLLYVLNPDPVYEPADGAVYTEYTAGGGQGVFINYGPCAFINQWTTYCDGSVPSGRPAYQEGSYGGRAELIYLILEEIFGLPSNGFGGGGTAGNETEGQYRWALGQNAPNPLAGTTEIRFEVARSSNVTIKIYNVEGQLVRTLVDGRRSPGRYTVTWNGTNQAGRRISSGVYFCRMEAGPYRATKKMLMVN